MNMAYAPGASKYVYRYGGYHYQYSYYREYYSQNQKRG